MQSTIKKKNFIILKNNITTKIKIILFQANYAEYNERNKIFKSVGPTKINI